MRRHARIIVGLVLCASAAPALAIDCAHYTRDALGIVKDVTDLFTSTLRKNVATSDLRCEFTGPIWSNREERHLQWCNQLPVAQSQSAIEQRLRQMKEAAQACKHDVAPRLSAAGSGPAHPMPGNATSTSSAQPTAPQAAVAANGAPAECPTAISSLLSAAGPVRCTCASGAGIRGMPGFERGISMDTLPVCAIAQIMGLVGPQGGVITVGDAAAMSSGGPMGVTTMRGGEGNVTTFGISGGQPAGVTAPPPADDEELVFTPTPGSQQGGIRVMQPPNPDATIHVRSATYGRNCPGVKAGNDTEAVADECDGFAQSCEYQVDTTRLPDPAPGCAKTYLVTWACGKDPVLHNAQAQPKPELSRKPTDLFVLLHCGD